MTPRERNDLTGIWTAFAIVVFFFSFFFFLQWQSAATLMH